MKLTLALLFVAFAAGAQVKSDTVTFTPKPDQLKPEITNVKLDSIK